MKIILLNIYKPLKQLNYLNYESEHIKPWQPRLNYNLLKQFSLPFNTAILFKADKFLHMCKIIKNLIDLGLIKTMFFCDRINYESSRRNKGTKTTISKNN